MNTKDIDILNVILIVVSLYAAFNIPFGLFIFSYVFFGPLHYLTEINWLNEKNYFMANKNWSYFFLICSIFLALPFFFQIPGLKDYFSSNWKELRTGLEKFSDEIYLIALLSAAGFLLIKDKIRLLAFILIAGTAGIMALHYFSGAALAIAIFVPTLIHVYVFTALFMIYGTLKNKTTPGIINIVLMLLVPFIIFMTKINPQEYYNLNQYTQTSYLESTFGVLNLEIAKWFVPIKGTNFNFLSELGIKIQIFVAFAYTYHYLNWFSKTSVIRWDKAMTKSKIVAILSIWIVSIGLYLYNFKVGFIVLSFISILHVLLEFPLNVTTIRELWKKVLPAPLSKA